MAERRAKKPAGVAVVDRASTGASAITTGSTARPAPQDDVVDRVWRLFCSMRLALILILLITAAIFVGTLLDQAPAGLTSADYSSWLARERLKYGAYTDLFSTLQLFIIYNSAWFKLLLASLMMNIVICTTNRWNGIWTTIAHPGIRMSEGFFQKAGRRARYEGGASPQEMAEKVIGELRARRYRILQEESPAGLHLYADKNHWSKLATFLTHLSFVVLLAGIILGSLLGFRETGFAIPEGSTRALGYGTQISVRVDAFADEYYPEGPPKDYRSDLVVFDNGQEVARKTIHVNDPLEYDGIRFFQAFFGQAAVIQVKDSQAQVLYEDGVALAWRSSQDEKRAVGNFELPAKGLTVYVVGPRSGQNDPLIPAGDVRLEIYQGNTQTLVAMENLSVGKSKPIGGLEYTFERERQFTGLQVSKDPGTNVVWLASALLVLGSMIVFYFPHRRLWVLCRPGKDGQTEVMVGTQAGRDLAFGAEFSDIQEGLSARLAPHSPT